MPFFLEKSRIEPEKTEFFLGARFRTYDARNPEGFAEYGAGEHQRFISMTPINAKPMPAPWTNEIFSPKISNPDKITVSE